MIQHVGFIADLVIGFSIVAAMILWLSYLFFLPDLRKSRVSKIACTLLLAGLSCLQLFHYQVWVTEPALFQDIRYVLLLLVIPPAFYLFSRSVLLPDAPTHWWHGLHFAPAALALVLPNGTALVIAFAIGAAYSLWFVYFVYGMRRAVARFRFEMFFFAVFAAQALLVFVLALSLPYIDATLFHLIYAMLAGIALILIVATMIVFPEAAADLSSVAQLSYSKSTLDSVDVPKTMQALEALMAEQMIYRNEGLSLAAVAEALGIGAHQLSELVNTRFGTSFSAYLRQQRVDAAKQLLVEQGSASVLSIGLQVGFGSQSNFYAAFKQIVGESPGAYRRRHS
ncbi:MAG: helix-turn-helix domain-containing protein [Pseudomonadota bacterium]